MRGPGRVALKFGVFVAVMTLATATLFLVFAQIRVGATNTYSALFNDVSRLKAGDSVRASGIRVGTVRTLSLQPDETVLVAFDADRNVVLTNGSRAAVRYLNLVGDRYLELIDGPGSATIMQPGARIPLDRTAGALDLDLLLGGLKPVIQGLNPQDVNALTASLIQIFEGQGSTMESLASHTASFSTALANNNQLVEEMIDNLNSVVTTLGDDGKEFSGAIDRFERLVSGLAQDRDPIGNAIDALSNGTASLTDLLNSARPPLAGTVAQLKRLAPLLDLDKGRVDATLQKSPNNYRKLVRLGAYGAFLNYYICGISVRVSDLQGRSSQFPWVKQEGGRCSEP
jgi:phospholipid/cholesterol/gamma-HCH transport system substrate-binding protein